MAVRFKARGSDGRVAIYTGTDDDPFDAPLSNMSRVLFHSDLHYPKIVREWSGSLSLPGRSAASTGKASHTLFAHGLSGTPLVFGSIVASGKNLPLCGSFPVQMTSRGWARWIALGATATNVVIGELWFAQNSGGFGAASVSLTVYVTDTVI